MRMNSILSGGAALACGLTLVGSAAQATTIRDARGDFLPSFVLNGDGQDHSDLDVLSATALRAADGGSVFLSSTQDGNVGLTENGIYVWGINRGSGVDLLNQEPFANPNDPGRPPVGAGVDFDAFIVLHQNGAADLHLVDIVDGHFAGLETAILFTPEDHVVSINGKTISVTIPSSLLRSTGRDFKDYSYNVWPRFRRVPDTNLVSDFGPDDRSFTASVPEPATWGLMIMGFGMAGAVLRRRRVVAA